MRNSALIIFEVQKRLGLQVLDLGATRTKSHETLCARVCSYRKLKVKVEKRKSLCPICGEELVKLHYLGVGRIVKERGSPDFVSSFLDDLVESDGSPNWCEAPSGGYVRSGSGSYEET